MANRVGARYLERALTSGRVGLGRVRGKGRGGERDGAMSELSARGGDSGMGDGLGCDRSTVDGPRGPEGGARRRVDERYWLGPPHGGRQLIAPRQFDLEVVAERARSIGGRLVVEGESIPSGAAET